MFKTARFRDVVGCYNMFALAIVVRYVFGVFALLGWLL